MGAVPCWSNLAAFSTRLEMARWRAEGRPSTVVSPATETRTSRPVRRRACTATSSARSARSTGRTGSVSDWPAARSTSSLTRSVSSRDSVARSSTSSSRTRGGSSSIRPSMEMLVRSEVSGVRSSWPASWTRRRWSSSDWASRSSMRSKARPRRPTSPAPVTGTWMDSRRVRATASAASVRATRRRVMRWASHQPKRPAAKTTATICQAVRRCSSRSRSSVSLNSWATCTAPRPPPSETVAMRYMSWPASMSACSTLCPAACRSAVRRSSPVTGRAGRPGSSTEPSGPRTCTTVRLGRTMSWPGTCEEKSSGVMRRCRTSARRSPTTSANIVCWSMRTIRAAAL